MRLVGREGGREGGSKRGRFGLCTSAPPQTLVMKAGLERDGTLKRRHTSVSKFLRKKLSRGKLGHRDGEERECRRGRMEEGGTG